jgi:hypothetical protein
MAYGIVMGLASKKSALFSQYRRAEEDVVSGEGAWQASLKGLFHEPGLAGAVAVVQHERGEVGGESASPYSVCGRVVMICA